MSKKLIFVPYAGGSSVTFKHWIKYMQPDVDMEIFELAGHGRRMFEDNYSSLTEAAEDLYRHLKDTVSPDESYYLSGHCVGAVIIFETCVLIHKYNDIPMPERIFISGHGSIEYIHDEEHVKDMSDREMIDHFIKEGGMSEEYLNDDLLELIIPPMRSDVAVYEDYRFDSSRDIPKVNMTVMYGIHDPQTPENELEAWKKFADDIDYVSFDDTHYFINTQQERYLDEIRKRIVEK